MSQPQDVKAAAVAGRARKPHALQRVSDAITHTVERKLVSLGGAAVRHPGRLALAATLITLVCAAGFVVNFNIEATGENLWPPQESRAQTDRAFYTKAYGTPLRPQQLLVTSKTRTNILTKEALMTGMDMYDKLVAVTSGDVTFDKICYVPPGVTECHVDGLLRHWGYDAKTLEDDNDIVSTAYSPTFPDGSPAIVSATIGGANVAAGTGEAFMITLLVDETRALEEHGLTNDDVLAWEKVFYDTAVDVVPESSNLIAYPQAGRSLDDEIAAAVGGDISLVASGITLMFVFSYFVITRRANIVASRFAVTWSGVLAIVLSIASAYGLLAYIGVPFTSLAQVLPFILFGIGVDDMYVITASVDDHVTLTPRRANQTEEEYEEEFRKQFATAMGDAGASITLTTATDVVAFSLGTFTTIPAIHWFCIYAATSVAFIFLMQLLVFSPALAMDLRRQRSGRYDVFCCARRKPAPVRAADAANSAPLATPQVSMLQKFLRSFYAPTLLRSKFVAGLVVLLFAGLAGAAVFGTTQLEQGLPLVDLSNDGSPVQQFFLEDKRYFGGDDVFNFQVVMKHEQSAVAQAVARGADAASTVDATVMTQLNMFSVHSGLLGSQYVDGSTITPNWWLPAFIQWASATPQYANNVVAKPAPANVARYGHGNVPGVDPSSASTASPVTDVSVLEVDYQTFVDAVVEWRTQPQFVRFEDIVAVIEGTNEAGETYNVLVASRFPATSTKMESAAFQVIGMTEIRDLVATDADPQVLPATAFSFIFLFVEMDAVIVPEAVQNMVLATTGVLIVCLLFLGSVRVTLIVCLVVGLIDLCLLGMLHYVDVKLNSVSVVNLVMALGLSVDFAAHIAHRVVHASKSPSTSHSTQPPAQSDEEAATAAAVPRPATTMSSKEAVAESLFTLGRSVLDGAASTGLAVLPLALSGSTIFRTFFVMFVGIVLLGITHGVVLLPVLLAQLPGGQTEVAAKRSSVLQLANVVVVSTTASSPSAAGARQEENKNPMDRSDSNRQRSDGGEAAAVDATKQWMS